MKDTLLNHYNEELGAIHKTSAEFAKSHPRVANHLHLGQRRNDDPFINHLIESFAFMSARVRGQIEDDNSLIGESILSVLYPHLLRPFPACGILQMETKKNCPDLYPIAKNTTVAVDVNETTLRFNTGYDVDIMPIAVTQAKMSHWTECNKIQGQSEHLESCLSLTIKTSSESESFQLEKLRLYLNCATEYRDDLFNLLMEHCKAIAISSDDDTVQPIQQWQIQNRGFGPGEHMLPAQPQSNRSHNLITEYFQFPDKFFFIDITLPTLNSNSDGEIQLQLYFDRHSVSLANEINADIFLTNCVPVINLYQTEAEPIAVEQIGQAYPVNADPYQAQDYHSVYSIDHVEIHDDANNTIVISPFYAAHQHIQPTSPYYWTSEAQAYWQTNSHSTSGHDTCLRLISNDELTNNNINVTCALTITATNNQLPQEIIPSSHPFYFWQSDHSNICDPVLITAMNPSRFPCKDEASSWQLVSLITQQHRLLGDQEQAKQWILSYLSLFDHSDQKELGLIARAISSIQTQPIVRRHPDSPRLGNCQGMAIKIIVDEEILSAYAFYPFALLLECFFIENISLNSFIEMSLHSQQKGKIAHWPAKIGLESTA